MYKEFRKLMSLFAGRNGDSETEHGLVDTVGKERVRQMESSINRYTRPRVKISQLVKKGAIQHRSPAWCSVRARKAGWGRTGRLQGEVIYV